MLSIRTAVSSVRGLLLAGVAAFIGTASTAEAGITHLRSTPYPTEQNHNQILANTYGGSFSAIGDGTSYSNGSVTATRVDDLNDVSWSAGKLSLTPIASFSQSQQTLGLLSGGNYQSLLSVSQFGYLPTSTQNLDLAGQHFLFTLDNSATNLRSASLNDVGDQLITYKIDGLNGKGSTYLLFWEDTPVSLGDNDYNDLVVQASFANGGPSAVPLPPAVLMGLMTMGGVATGVVWKRRKAAAIA